MAETGQITYSLKIITLTPLHIGSGRMLVRDYDFAVHGGKTWRLDEKAFLDAQDVDQPEIQDRLIKNPPGQLLQERDFTEGNPLFRYGLQGEPQFQEENTQIAEQIKNTFDRPYLPGSSLKGALRTALAWAALYAGEIHINSDQFTTRKPEYAGQNIERRLFGTNPNQDLLRALQVTDSTPLEPSALRLINAAVVSPHLSRGGAMPVRLEALPAGITLDCEMRIDLSLFDKRWTHSRLELSGEEWLAGLFTILQLHARRRVAEEIAWCRSIPQARESLHFYEELERSPLGDGVFPLRLGWGTGWGDKTLGEHLTADTGLFKFLQNMYHLSPGNYLRPEAFPTCRRVASEDGGSPGKEGPRLPMGWVSVTATPQQPIPQHFIDLGKEFSTNLREKIARNQPPLPEPPKEPRPVRAPAPAPAERRAPLPPQGEQEPRRPDGRSPAEKPSVKPAPPPPPPRPRERLVTVFTGLPQVGDRFFGMVYSSEEDGSVYLEIPGISADDLALGVLAKKDNPGLTPQKEGKRLDVKVISVTEEKPGAGYWLVGCRLAG